MTSTAEAQTVDSSNRDFVGWFLLVVSLGIALITLYRGTYVDEGDNLAVGNLILQGYNLYSEVFSHHFPFPYYWVAAVVGLFGKSIVAVRLSVLAFQILAFGLASRSSGNHLLVGITAVIWSIVRPFYQANMVLYSSFAGAALLPVLLVALSILQQRITPSWKHWLISGLFSIIALLSDPISIYPIVVVLLFLSTKKPVWGMSLGLVVGSGLSLYVGYLYVTGNLQAFWNDAILFNSQVYARYVDTNPLRISELFDMAIKGLGIADEEWLILDPFKPVSKETIAVGRWVFTGFLYRFSIIATTLFLALRKQFRAAGLLYLFAASTMIISTREFRAQPFIIVSLAAISALIANEWWREVSSRLLRTTQIFAGIIVLVVTGWLCWRLMVDIHDNMDTYGEGQVAGFKKDSAQIQELACHQPDVMLAHYPGGPYYYWFTGMKPVSKYVFMWPWVADVGLDDVIHELSQDQALAIVVMQECIIWGTYDTKVYLRPLDEFLEANYHKVTEGIYMSPALRLRCPESSD